MAIFLGANAGRKAASNKTPTPHMVWSASQMMFGPFIKSSLFDFHFPDRTADKIKF